MGRYGFTLAEALMAVAILAFAVAGVLLPFTSAQAVRAEGVRRTLAAELASDLMEKIIRTPFDRIVDNFDGYSETEGQLKDAAGRTLASPNYAYFSREANCEYVYVPQEDGTKEPKFIHATVRVYYRDREMATINRLISK